MLLGQQGSSGSSVSLLRDDEQLVGAINGVNQVFTLPNSEKALVVDPGVKIKVYYNGQRFHEGGANDFSSSESGGAGTGFDTVTFNFVTPIAGDIVTADYTVTP